MHLPFFTSSTAGYCVSDRFRTFTCFLLIAGLQLLTVVSVAQSVPGIKVDEFSYLIPPTPAGKVTPTTEGRVIYAFDDSLASLLAGSLTRSMNQRWGADLKNLKLNIDKATNGIGFIPKFKPKPEPPEPGKIHVFLRIIDYGQNPKPQGNINLSYLMQDDRAPVTLGFYCKAINGADGTETFAREMRVVLEKEAAQPGNYQLHRLPATPTSFINAFDSAAGIFFGPVAEEFLILKVKPPCLFIPDSVARQIKQRVRFDHEETLVRQVEGTGFAWNVGKLQKEFVTRLKTGDGAVGTAITVLTGMSTTKTKMNRNFGVVEMSEPGNNNSYVFKISYIEEETGTRERQKTVNANGGKSYDFNTTNDSYSRYLDRYTQSLLISGNDTIATFMLSQGSDNMEKSFPYFWDGRDTTSISPLPQRWSNGTGYANLMIDGLLYGKPFALRNTRDGHQLDAYYENKHVATLRMSSDRPQDGVVYQTDLPQEVLKAFAMFTCIPYSFFTPVFTTNL